MAGTGKAIKDRSTRSAAQALAGVWDLRTAPLSLGGALIFAAELGLQAAAAKATGVTVCIVDRCDGRPLFPGRADACSLDSTDIDGVPALRVLAALEGIAGIVYAPTPRSFGIFVEGNPRLQIWPGWSESVPVSHRYADTVLLQEWFRRNRWIPVLSCKESLLRWAEGFHHRYVGSAIPVAVHLKNNPKERGCSNADFEAWYSFFQESPPAVRFLLVGNETVDDRIVQLSNVLVTQTMDSDVARDMALIQCSCAFMGMATGPCQMAMFGRRPYVIFKNPDHHAREMAAELGDADRYAFAAPGQKILRRFETKDGLTAELTALLSAAKANGTLSGAI